MRIRNQMMLQRMLPPSPPAPPLPLPAIFSEKIQILGGKKVRNLTMLLKTKQFWFVRYRSRNKLLFSSAHLFLVEDSYKAQSRVLDVCGFRLVKPTESWRHHKIYTHSSKGPRTAGAAEPVGAWQKMFFWPTLKRISVLHAAYGGNVQLISPVRLDFDLSIVLRW